MTGKRLLRLEHGQRVQVGVASKTKGRRPREGGGSGVAGAGGDDGGKADEVDGPPLSGLEEEGSDTSSSSGSDDGS